MRNEIFWENPGYKVRRELRGDITCDYLIVGGGITGVSAAYFLQKSGAKRIVLVEKHYIGSGATGKAAGTIVTRGERDLTDMIDQVGLRKARSEWLGVHKALQGINEVIKKEKIKCDAELQDTLMCGFKGRNWNDLRKEYEAEKKIESSTKFLEGDDLKKEINSNLFTHGVLSKGHALCLNPLKFVQGFSEALERHGVTIHENTAVLNAGNNIAETRHGKIKYKKIIWAIDTDYPEKNVKNLRTTVIVTRPLTRAELEEIGFSKRKKVVWDSRKNEYYFKITKEARLLAGFGGVIVHKKHRKTDPHLPHIKQLKNFIKILFPYLNLKAEYAWSGHFGVNKHYSQGPFISVKGNEAVISGAGSQVVCFMSAEYAVNKLLGKPAEKPKLPESFI